jgi:hypothetical protein
LEPPKDLPGASPFRRLPSSTKRSSGSTLAPPCSWTSPLVPRRFESSGFSLLPTAGSLLRRHYLLGKRHRRPPLSSVRPYLTHPHFRAKLQDHQASTAGHRSSSPPTTSADEPTPSSLTRSGEHPGPRRGKMRLLRHPLARGVVASAPRLRQRRRSRAASWPARHGRAALVAGRTAHCRTNSADDRILIFSILLILLNSQKSIQDSKIV